MGRELVKREVHLGPARTVGVGPLQIVSKINWQTYLQEVLIVTVVLQVEQNNM